MRSYHMLDPEEAEGPSESFPSQIEGHRHVLMASGVIVCHLVPHETVSTQYYRDFLVPTGTPWCSRDKRPYLVDGAIILHNSARSHKAGVCSGYSDFGDGKNCSSTVLYHCSCDFDLIPIRLEPTRE
ncbi:hypothetical protein TNIN_389081 [Trichonephila inaurata madagascariensis]|uniref:Uncharacterized protein n=1 Tax=Trichonephila inaurata madagascariensis TaxID=2747483 RepID=A0A8X6YFJ4_9ARAC|nr:hypothetical protein TNIN_389081 [Trichonephila inaurata madagascariensis]